MHHSFEIDRQTGLLREEFTGSLNLESLSKANAAILAHPHFEENLKFRTDLRDARILFGSDEMREHIASLPPLHISRQAFIVSGDLEFGMIRMFISLMQQHTAERQEDYSNAAVFKKIEEGMTWLISSDTWRDSSP